MSDMDVFGPPWDASAYEHGRKVTTPVGDRCMRCDAPIQDGQQGVVIPYYAEAPGIADPTQEAWHLDCFLRAVLPPGVAWARGML